MNLEALYQAVAKHLEGEALKAEQAEQTREFSRNERIAFRRGFYRGMSADVLRAPEAVWEQAAQTLTRGVPEGPPVTKKPA